MLFFAKSYREKFNLREFPSRDKLLQIAKHALEDDESLVSKQDLCFANKAIVRRAKRGLSFLRRCECRIVTVATLKQCYYAIKKIKTERDTVQDVCIHNERLIEKKMSLELT